MVGGERGGVLLPSHERGDSHKCLSANHFFTIGTKTHDIVFDSRGAVMNRTLLSRITNVIYVFSFVGTPLPKYSFFVYILTKMIHWQLLLFFRHRAKKAELAASYLRWASDPIHKSLIDISGLKGEAKKQFKNLLGYCGDRKYQYPDPLIRDIVAKGEHVLVW